jgi:hypothetical protein
VHGANQKEEASIDVEKITSAPVEVPDDAALAKKESFHLAHEQEYFRKELGWLGRPFGGRTEKPGNISALVIVLCFVAMAVVYLKPEGLGNGITIKEAFQSLMSVVTLILGYLFGSNDRAGKDH